jgi:heptosyltransferase-3
MNRILIIRGGAIGDFILTLPALRALREAYPNAALDILGYKHIAAVAENRFYAQAVRSIEYAPLSGFFAKDGDLNSDLREYFRSFDLVISYLFDPDGIFEANLRRCGATRIVIGPAKIQDATHAARQLAQPVEQLGIEVNHWAAKLFPTNEDWAFARGFLDEMASPVVALHVGSGSVQKNWALENWIALGNSLLGNNVSLLVGCGEADQTQADALQRQWQNANVHFAIHWPLPQLAAVLGECVFVGHDSGISHLAAAAGAKCLLLFGPTDPAVWAPLGPNVRIIRALTQRLDDIEIAAVGNALDQVLV